MFSILVWPTCLSVLPGAAGMCLQAVKGYAQSAGAIANVIGLIAGGLASVAIGTALFPIAASAIASSAGIAALYRSSASSRPEAPV